MSNRETKPQTTTTKATKRSVGRPKKSAATTPPKRAAKARIVTVTDSTTDAGKHQTANAKRPIDRVVDGAVTLGQEIEKHKSQTRPSKKSEATNNDVMAALRALERGLAKEANALHHHLDDLNDKLDKGIEIFTGIKRDVAKISRESGKKSRWPWRRS